MQLKTRLLFLFLASAGCGSQAQAVGAVAQAAIKFHPATQWRESSIQNGDFACRGNQVAAILGTSKSEVIVAIFADGLNRKPHVLRYLASMPSQRIATLTIENLDFNVEEFERSVGELPNGLLPSKTCQGLSVTEQQRDAVHIYWNRKDKRFQDWSR